MPPPPLAEDDAPARYDAQPIRTAPSSAQQSLSSSVLPRAVLAHQRHSRGYTSTRSRRSRSFHLPHLHSPSLIDLGIEEDFDEIQRNHSSVTFFSFAHRRASSRPWSSSITYGANPLSEPLSPAHSRQMGRARAISLPFSNRHPADHSYHVRGDQPWHWKGRPRSYDQKALPQLPQASLLDVSRSGSANSTTLLLPILLDVASQEQIRQPLRSERVQDSSCSTVVHHGFLSPPARSQTVPGSSITPGPEPRPTFTNMSSLDNILRYRLEKAEWKRSQSTTKFPGLKTKEIEDDSQTPTPQAVDQRASHAHTVLSTLADPFGQDQRGSPSPTTKNFKSKFRHPSVEYGFWFTLCMTQFLNEFLLSGFSIELSRQLTTSDTGSSHGTGKFWPASLLTLILSATILIWARLADMYGGYPVIMFGFIWLTIWSLIPGFSTNPYVLDVSRSMQGLAIATFSPAVFVLLGGLYPEGKRKTFVMGLWTGSAPIGFFAGFLVAGAVTETRWYFWIAALVSAAAAIIAFLTIPVDDMGRDKMRLKMDWLGALLISGGLILISYALSVEPYAGEGASPMAGWSSSRINVPLGAGAICLVFAFCVEGWVAECPLLPFDFFLYKDVKRLCLACLFFYASYGVWLYYSAEYFHIPAMTAGGGGITGVRLAIWYTPTAVGGLIFCVLGGTMLDEVPAMVLLIGSALAWVGAPLCLALAPLNMSYWIWVFPSMVCATAGIDLTLQPRHLLRSLCRADRESQRSQHRRHPQSQQVSWERGPCHEEVDLGISCRVHLRRRVGRRWACHLRAVCPYPVCGQEALTGSQ